MAANLTFEIGRRPGIAGRQPRKPLFGMSFKQRAALAELVHGSGAPRRPAPQAGESRSEFVWYVVLALVFVLCGLSLFEGVRAVGAEEAQHVVKAPKMQVDVTIRPLPAANEALRAAAPNQSSVAVSRTM